MELRIHLVFLWSIVMTSTLGTPITGPEPMTVVAPVGTTRSFTCVVNTNKLPADTTFHAISWIVNSDFLPADIDQEANNGSVITSTLQRTVIQDYITGVPVQCRVIVLESGMPVPIKSNNATLTAYGPPEAPSNLTSTQFSSNALILSWSAPSSPVQLHYTVIVNTSTTIKVTNDTNITITREEVMTAINSTECDIYTFSVTATNPAGSSLPTNIIAPVTFVTAPNVTASNIGSTLYIVVKLPEQAATDFSTVSVELVNSCTNESYPDKILLLENNSWTYNVTDLQNWTSITVIAENQCRNVSVPVNISTTLVCPNTDPVTTPTTPTPTVTTMMTTSLPVWGIVLLVLAVLILIITIIGGLCLWRKKRGKTYSLNSASVLPKYADAHKVMGLFGRQQEGCSSAYGFFCKKKKNQSKTCSESSVELEGVVSSDKCPNKKTDMPIGLNILGGEVSSNISEDSAEGPKIASQGQDCPP